MRRLLFLVLLLLSTGCAGGPGSDTVQVVAGAYPFAWVAEQVGGRTVEVTNLVKPGAEPHDVELSPRQVGAVQGADLVLRLDGFQAAVDDAVGDRDNSLDLVGPMQQADDDPHVWLDPLRMVQASTAIGERLAALDVEHADRYRTNAEALNQRLRALDLVLRTAVTDCARKDIVTSHAAFGYLADRYGLVQRGISGLSPDAEPSPKRVAEVARYARDHGVTTIFFESLVDPKVARTVADEIGASTAVLDPIEGVTGGDDYLSVQRRNAEALHDALGCA